MSGRAPPGRIRPGKSRTGIGGMRSVFQEGFVGDGDLRFDRFHGLEFGVYGIPRESHRADNFHPTRRRFQPAEFCIENELPGVFVRFNLVGGDGIICVRVGFG